MKYVTRALILAAVFVAAVWFMGKDMAEDKYSIETAEKIVESTFPTVSVVNGDYEYDMLYGYSGNLEASNFREAIIPLDTSKTLSFLIRQNGVNVKKVSYEVTSVETGEALATGSMSALEQHEEGKLAKFKLEGDFVDGTEYALDITVVTERSKKIHYFARVKYIEQPLLSEQLNFIMGFHEASFDEEKFEDYENYLDKRYYYTDGKVEYLDAVSKVNSYSPKELVTWSGMKPQVLTEVIPTIKEINSEVISVELSYMIKGTIPDENGNPLISESTYQVKEFYRVKYTPSKIYLLSYYRTMDNIYDMNTFDPTTLDAKDKIINLGISQDDKVEVASSTDDKYFAFVNHGTLWYYNIEKNQVVDVYSLMNQDMTYYHGGYDANNIRILDIDSAGNMDFIVYGYINRGDYEGRVGLVLYKYMAGDNRIEEQAYIPLEYPYEILERKIADFNYLSNLDVYYFAIDGAIYAYNITTRKLEVLSDDVSSQSATLSKAGEFIVWQDFSQAQLSKTIHILNLETESHTTIEAKQGENIVLLGLLHENFCYGVVDHSAITTSQEGTQIVPVKALYIADVEGKILKTYEPKGKFVSSVSVKDNTMTIELIKKDGGSYVSAGEDFIVNKIEETTSQITYGTRVITKDMEQLYIKLPTSFEVNEKPNIVSSKTTIITEDTTVHIQSTEKKETSYYAIGRGHILEQFTFAADAIAMADSYMGVAINESNQLIWERGETKTRSMIATINEIPASSKVNSIGACISMLLKYNHIQVDGEELTSSGVSIYDGLEQHLDATVINLKGATLEQVLYYVSHKRPVIAMKDSKNAVLLIGYDETSVTYYDPAMKKTEKVGKTAATTMFEDAGNVFVSYVN